MSGCSVCGIDFTSPPVPGLRDCIEGHVCEECLEPNDLPDNLPEAVQELLNVMDADIYYDAAEHEDWGPQETIDYLFELRAHVQRLLEPEPKLCTTCGQGLSDCLTFGCFAGANDGCGPDRA